MRELGVYNLKRFYYFCYFTILQLRGMYMTRQLSFAGVTFDIKELPLAKDFIDMYDASVKLVSYIPCFS